MGDATEDHKRLQTVIPLHIPANIKECLRGREGDERGGGVGRSCSGITLSLLSRMWLVWAMTPAISFFFTSRDFASLRWMSSKTSRSRLRLSMPVRSTWLYHQVTAVLRIITVCVCNNSGPFTWLQMGSHANNYAEYAGKSENTCDYA